LSNEYKQPQFNDAFSTTISYSGKLYEAFNKMPDREKASY